MIDDDSEPTDFDFDVAIAALRAAHKTAANVAAMSSNREVAERHARQARSLAIVIAYLQVPVDP
jgi:hypothetical protein